MRYSTYKAGGTPDSENEQYWNGDINWATLVDLPANDYITYLSDTERKITTAGLQNSSAKLLPRESVLVSSRATIGRIAINNQEVATNQGFKNILIKDKTKVYYKFVAYAMTYLRPQMNALAIGGTFKEISKTNFATLEIPLPSLEEQRAIVAEIEGYQRIIDAAQTIVNNYHPQITINPNWQMVELRTVCDVNPKKSEISKLPASLQVSFLPMADLSENDITFKVKETKELKDVYTGYTYFRDNDVLLAKVTPCFENGKAGLAKNLTNGIGFGSSEFFVLRAKDSTLPEWIYVCVKDLKFKEQGKNSMTGTGGLQRIPKDFVAAWKIPLPDIDTQKQIIAEIEREQAAVDRAKELIEIFTKKISNRIAQIWNE